MIGGGHFISLQRTASIESQDNQSSSDFWFGPIDITTAGQAIETVMTSSLEGYAETQQSLQLVLIDQDHFSQTLTVDGFKVTEIYTRL